MASPYARVVVMSMVKRWVSLINSSALVALGGEQKYEIDLVKFPVSDEFIRKKNREVRASIRKYASIFWGLILLALIGIFSIIYFLINWAINA